MFKIDETDGTTIKCTRGDKGNIIIKKKIVNNSYESFYEGDVVIFTVKTNFGDTENLLKKTKKIIEDCEQVEMEFTSDDTRIGDLISSPVTYQYDICVNGDTTILGYDENGPKKFILYPEGGNDTL